MNTQTLRWSDIEMSEGSTMKTLSSNEVEEVSGGIFPVVIFGVTITTQVAIKVAALAVAGAGAAAFGYYNNRR